MSNPETTDHATENNRLRAWLVNMVEIYAIRSELFTNDADCAASLADRAKAALDGVEIRHG